MLRMNPFESGKGERGKRYRKLLVPSNFNNLSGKSLISFLSPKDTKLLYLGDDLLIFYIPNPPVNPPLKTDPTPC
jgi:hypothetical protein